VTSQQSDMER